MHLPEMVCVPVLIMTYPVFLKIKKYKKTFNNLNMWVQTIFHSFMALKPSVIPKKKMEANALFLAGATAGLVCLYYLTTYCSLAAADRLA